MGDDVLVVDAELLSERGGGLRRGVDIGQGLWTVGRERRARQPPRRLGSGVLERDFVSCGACVT